MSEGVMSLVIEQLSAAYDGYPVFQDFSLVVNASEPTGIIGLNGVGKTTLMKAIMSLIPARTGKVIFQGIDITRLRSHEIVSRGLTLIPEGRQVFTKMTVRENLEVGAHTLRRGSEIKRKLNSIYDSFPLFHQRQNQYAGSLSGGEQQLLVIARGLMCDPKFLLIDEPFLGLAPAGIEMVQRALMDIHKRGVGLLIAEEDSKLLSGVTEKIHTMN
jgi:branched-chain amino acid transport system ATP-binding protein